MTERLTELLDRASDVDTRDLVAAAEQEAARRRRSRRRTTVLAVVAATVAVVAGGAWLSRPDDDAIRMVPRETTFSPRPDVNGTVWPRWDPFSLPDTPRGDSVLPQRLVAPTSAASVLDEPLPGGAVLAWPREGEDLLLLSTSGEWRSVPGTATANEGLLYEPVTPDLSADGRRLVMATIAGLRVVDVTTGQDEVIDWSEETAGPWDTAPCVEWLDPGRIVVKHWQTWWIASLDGTFTPAPWTSSGRFAVDPINGVVQVSRWRREDLRTWDGDQVVARMDFPWWGERFAAGFGMVAFTGGGGTEAYGTAGPMVLDPATERRLAYLPIRDRNGEYSDNGGLTVLGFLDADTTLIKVAPRNFSTTEPGKETWYLVSWDFRTNEVRRLTEGGADARTVIVAEHLVQ